MNLLKKLGVLLLTTVILTSSIFVNNTQEVDAATSCIKTLSINKVYKYDIDGDGDKDTIKVYRANGNLVLKVNNCVKTLISRYNPSDFVPTIKIYNFNKNDKSSEIVLEWAYQSEWGTKILKFKNNTCKVNKDYYDAMIHSYNPNTGMITFTEYDYGRYKSFSKAIGGFGCYSQVKVNGYNLYNQSTANTISMIRENRYIADKNLTAYTSTKGTKKFFTIKKNQPVYVYALYQNGNKKYIKVKNSAGKYGYIKVGSSMLFKRSSCIFGR